MRPRTCAVASVAVPAALLLATTPFGGQPVNDDWQMAWSAFHFARTGELRILDYSAMGLVGWSSIGGALAALVGESFLALRLLTMAVHAAAGWFAWRAATERGLAPRRALAVSLVVTLCPVTFWLATSFMTDAPFHAAWVGALWAWSGALRNGSPARFAVGAALVAWAAWVRLPVVALPIALVLAVLVARADAVVRRRALVAAGTSVIAGPAAFLLWYHGVHGATAAYRYKSSVLAAEVAGNAAGGTFAAVAYAGLFLLPLAPWALSGGTRPSRAPWFAAAAFAGLALFQARTGALGGIVKSMPYLPNVVYNLGLGPMTLTDVLREGGPPPVRVPGAFQVAAGVLLAAAGAALVVVAARRVAAAVRARTDPATLLLGAAAVLLVGAAVLFSRASAPLFDRYLVPAILPAALLLVPPAGDRDGPAGGGVRRAASATGALLVAVGAFATLGTRDYHRFTEARFRLADEAVRRAGTTFLVDAGAEFNLWHHYVPSTRGEFTPAPGWKGWLADPGYVVATRERPGYDVVSREHVLSVVGWKEWDLLLLRRRGE